MGSWYCQYVGYASPQITIWVLITAILLQITSNYANDYGDFMKGTDHAGFRPDRAVASGKISSSNMLKATLITAFLGFLSGVYLLYISFNGIPLGFVLFLLLGLLSIGAAIFYTIGKYAYGYKAMGDVFVFVFFGPVAVLGMAYLHMHHADVNLRLSQWKVLAGCVFLGGIPPVGVLTINNIRDIAKDGTSGKTTIPLLLGFKKARIYFTLLSVITLLSFIWVIIHLADVGIYYSIASTMILAIVLGTRVKSLFRLKPEDRDMFNKELKNNSLVFLIIPAMLWIIYII
jgi:1,4-dihydroxy-2-naphthoate polyprenyltransferase